MTKMEYEVLSSALKTLEQNLCGQLEALRNSFAFLEEDHDCGLDKSGEGHCSHESHVQV